MKKAYRGPREGEVGCNPYTDARKAGRSCGNGNEQGRRGNTTCSLENTRSDGPSIRKILQP